MDIQEKLAQTVRTRRKALGMSQEDLAAACDLDRTYISGIERGIRNPTIKVLQRLSSALETKVSNLLE